ncbi:MAG TPA: glycosyltransferase [Ktedonobacterales bacterium]|jgi:glycosyltransferase involved in cell wall biosynthesis
MRIALISKTFVAGAAQRQLEWIAQQPGVELTLITPRAWRMDDGRTWTFSPAYARGYQTRSLELRFNGHYHHYAYLGLERVIDELRPNLLHIDEEPYNYAGFQAQRIATARRIPTIFVALQSIYRRYPPPYSLFEQYDYRRTAHIISVNSDVETVIRRKGYSGRSSVFYVYGVDPEIVYPHPREPRMGDQFVVGYVGRLLFDKGLGVLTEAIASLPPSYRLRLIGGGPDREALERLAASKGVAHRVEFAGAVSSQEIPRAFAAMDVMALPSLTRKNWKEQFGRVLIEAMACETPVIGSDSGEIPNVIGDAGLVTPEGDVQALAAAIARLGSDPALRADLASRGRQRVLDNFTQEQVARRTVGLYQEVLGGAGRMSQPGDDRVRA